MKYPKKLAPNPQPSMKGPKPTAAIEAAKGAHPAAKNLGKYLHPKKRK